MKKVLFFIFSILVTKILFAETNRFSVRVYPQTSGIQGGLNTMELIVTGPTIVDKETGRASALTSTPVTIPFHGLNVIRIQNLKTYMDPFVIALILEKGLNEGILRLEEVKDMISSSDWLSKAAIVGNNLLNRVDKFTQFSVRVYPQTSGIQRGLNTMELIVTGPTIIDKETGRASALTSTPVTIPFHGLNAIRIQNLKTYIDPFVIALILEKGLNEGILRLEEVKNMISSSDWLSKAAIVGNNLLNRVDKFTQFSVRVYPQTSGIQRGLYRMELIVTGPGIVDKETGRESTLTSTSFTIPFHGLNKIRVQNITTYIDPFVIAAILENGLNEGTLDTSQVNNFMNGSEWMINVDNLLQSPPSPTRICKTIGL